MLNIPLEVYPRTGGGNFGFLLTNAKSGGLSPHGRGKPVEQLVVDVFLRSIPARAGETQEVGLVKSKPPVYPRTGGGNWAGIRPRAYAGGLSPHGRGKR